jgi:hypothetical protein
MTSPVQPLRRLSNGSRRFRLMASACALLTLWAVFDSPTLLTFASASSPSSSMPQDDDDDVLSPLASFFPGDVRSAIPPWKSFGSAESYSTAASTSLPVLTAPPSDLPTFLFGKHNGCGADLRC